MPWIQAGERGVYREMYCNPSTHKSAGAGAQKVWGRSWAPLAGSPRVGDPGAAAMRATDEHTPVSHALTYPINITFDLSVLCLMVRRCT
jgi:hypothetical protein